MLDPYPFKRERRNAEPERQHFPFAALAETIALIVILFGLAMLLPDGGCGR